MATPVGLASTWVGGPVTPGAAAAIDLLRPSLARTAPPAPGVPPPPAPAAPGAPRDDQVLGKLLAKRPAPAAPAAPLAPFRPPTVPAAPALPKPPGPPGPPPLERDKDAQVARSSESFVSFCNSKWRSMPCWFFLVPGLENPDIVPLKRKGEWKGQGFHRATLEVGNLIAATPQAQAGRTWTFVSSW